MRNLCNRIVRYIKQTGAPQTMAQICKGTKRSEGDVCDALDRLRLFGRVKMIRQGHYELKSVSGWGGEVILAYEVIE